MIAFHSLEDRIVKHGLRALADRCVCPPGLPICGCGRESLVRILEAADDTEVEDIGWRDALYYRYYESEGPHTVPKHEGVRTRRWKLIDFHEIGEVEMYDLDNDPDEMNSIADDPEHAATRARLETLLARLREQYRVPPVE